VQLCLALFYWVCFMLYQHRYVNWQDAFNPYGVKS
jgi:hypothetical protein